MSTCPILVPPPTRPPARPVLPYLVLLPSPDQPTLPLEREPEPARVDPRIPAETERLVRALAVVLADVLRGRRPFAHAEHLADGEVLDTILHLARSQAARGLRLASIRLQAPVEDVIELTLGLASGGHRRALAVRLERRRSRWQCVTLEAALTDAGITRCGRLTPRPGA